MKFNIPALAAPLALAVFLISAPLLPAASEKAGGPFIPEWESLRQYRCPDWFRDAKFGIYAHWGPYSAAKGLGNTDWYGRHMYQPGHENRIFHEKTYGPVSKFGYKDLVPLFTAEKFNADEWAELYVEAGARFAGPVAEHADGFSMWRSEVNPWNAAAMGPKRDVVAEMERAVRKRGLNFLVSMHHSWLWGWFPTWDKETDASDPQYASLYGPAYPETAQGITRAGGQKDIMSSYPLPSAEWQQVWLAKIKEVVSRYSPDVLWFDNRMQIITERNRKEMAAYYYNQAASRGQQPVLTYKRPDLELGTGTIDLERSRMPDIFPEPWLTDTSISRDSWAFASDLECYSTDRIVDDLVDIVSKNGCMLLNIAPAPDGTIPEEQKQILRGVGRWLRLNGEAIYGSRPWILFGEGPTMTPVGHLADQKFNGFTSRDIRFTTREGALYAIALGWPEEGNSITIESLGAAQYPVEITGVSLLGHDGTLVWRSAPEGLIIDLPATKPCEHAFVFKLTLGAGR